MTERELLKREKAEVVQELESLTGAIDEKDCPYLRKLAERAETVLERVGA